MNDQSWINEIDWQIFESPATLEGDEEVYTLKMRDFLQMPNVDFMELAAYDPEIRALLN